MRASTKYIVVIFFSFTTVRCAPSVVRASTRNPDLFEKEGSALKKVGSSPSDFSPPEMYVRQPNLTLKPREQANDTGSLMNLDDERNFLYTSATPHRVGRFVTVKIATNLQKEEKKPDESKKSDGASKDNIEKEIIDAIPELAPADEGKTKLLDHLKMEIKHTFDNGDVLALLKRRSVSGVDVEDMTVSARIPYDRLMGGDALTTDDLIDVKFVSSKDGEIVESRSSGWEDEYSLRLSGFDEAKSKFAKNLDDKRRKIEEASKKLQSRLKSFSKEREQVAKQRDELSQEKSKFDAEKARINKQIDENTGAEGADNPTNNRGADQLQMIDTKAVPASDSGAAAAVEGAQ